MERLLNWISSRLASPFSHGILVPIFVMLPTVFCFPSYGQNSSVNSCVLEICKQTDFIASANGVGPLTATIDSHTKQYLIDSIYPKLNQIIEYDLKNAINLTSLWNSYVSQPADETTLTEGQKILMAFTIITNLDQDFFSQVLSFNPDSTYSVNKDRVEKLMPAFSSKQTSWIVEILNAFLNSDGFQSRLAIINDPIELYLAKLLGDSLTIESLTSVLATRAQIVTATIGPNTAFSATEISLLLRLPDYQSMTSYEKQALNSVIAKTYQTYEMVREGRVKSLALDLPFNKEQFVEFLKPKLQTVVSALKSNSTVARIRSEALQYCSKMSNSYISSTPSDLKLRIAQRNIERIKSAAISTLPKYFGEENISAATEAIRRIEFRLPLSRSEAKPALESHFNDRVSDSQQRSVATPNLNSLLVFIMYMGSAEEGLFEMILQDTHRYCFDLEPAPIIDAALFSDPPQVSVGWQSVFWPKHGASVISHEIGHVVEGFIKDRAELNEPNQCFDKQHRGFYGADANVDGSQNDEDWADNFSISVQRQLVKTYGDLYSGNHACLLLDMDESGAAIMPEEYDLTRDSLGRHSSTIFRLLQLENQTRGLPTSCTSVPEIREMLLPACAK